jgi:hypothetical protein
MADITADIEELNRLIPAVNSPRIKAVLQKHLADLEADASKAAIAGLPATCAEIRALLEVQTRVFMEVAAEGKMAQAALLHEFAMLQSVRSDTLEDGLRPLIEEAAGKKKVAFGELAQELKLLNEQTFAMMGNVTHAKTRIQKQ